MIAERPVQQYLRHLEAAGFDGAPRLLGIEDDREALTFLDGDVARAANFAAS